MLIRTSAQPVIKLLLMQERKATVDAAVSAHQTWLRRQYKAFQDSLLQAFVIPANLDYQVEFLMPIMT